VVALTRHDDHTYVQKLLEAGAAAYVLKQSASVQLLRAIRVAAAGGRFLDPALPPPDLPRDPRRRDSTPLISDRETEILRLIAVGNSNKEIANALNISVKTVEAHKSNGMRKLGLRGRADVVRYAMLNDWLRDL
jgi:DNA-binding NarL/FixJ family response regulator